MVAFTSILNLLSKYPIRSTVTCSILLSTLWNAYLTRRQYLRYKTVLTPPSALTPYIDDETFRKSRFYSADKMRLAIYSSLINFVFTIITMTTSMFPWTWSFCENIVSAIPRLPTNEITTSIALVVLSIPISTLLSIPFSIYGTFVIEEKYGFNKMTPKLFTTDLIKGTVLKLVLAPPLVALLLFIISHTGSLFYVYASITLFLLSLVFSIVIPNFILPLFNKFSPIEDPLLSSEIDRLSRVCDFPIKEVFSMDASKRSSHSNAFFIGIFAKARKLVLYDTLITKLTVEEVVAVLGHEIGHKKKRHTTWMLVLGQVNIFLMMFLFSRALSLSSQTAVEFGMSAAPIILSLGLFSSLLAPTDEIISVLVNMLMRRFERQADTFAVNISGFEMPLKEALVKLNLENLSDSDPDWLYQLAHHSHPSLAERIALIDELNAEKKQD
ncbi:hypothetical protein RCL1_000352 [Eukaryota sp. TZLM3-RCL]